MITKQDIIRIYRRRAGQYDLTMNLYRLVGFAYDGYRRKAVSELGLGPGDTVVELGCGTGANLPLLRKAVGPAGRIVGVDLTDRMLEEAQRKVRRNHWNNVELVLSDMADYRFESRVDGVISTFALTLSNAYDSIIERAARALGPGGRFVVLDLKEPTGWPEWVVRVGLWTLKPFGVSLESGVNRPWESVRRHFAHTWMQELFFGVAYIAVGENRGTEGPNKPEIRTPQRTANTE